MDKRLMDLTAGKKRVCVCMHVYMVCIIFNSITPTRNTDLTSTCPIQGHTGLQPIAEAIPQGKEQPKVGCQPITWYTHTYRQVVSSVHLLNCGGKPHNETQRSWKLLEPGWRLESSPRCEERVLIPTRVGLCHPKLISTGAYIVPENSTGTTAHFLINEV